MFSSELDSDSDSDSELDPDLLSEPDSDLLDSESEDASFCCCIISRGTFFKYSLRLCDTTETNGCEKIDREPCILRMILWED
jgi:hypothetical protein